MPPQAIADHIVAVTQDVFGMMLDMEASPVEPAAPKPYNETLLAIVGLAGPYVGSGSLSCDADHARTMAGRMLGTHFAAVNDEVMDAFGEIANMVVGNLKNNLEIHLGQMGLSVPTVIYGCNFRTRTLGRQDWTSVDFECGGGRVSVQVILTETGASNETLAHALALAI
jgi:chemotaxis protein CheX